MRLPTVLALGALTAVTLLSATDFDRDFSGKWVLDHASRDLSADAWPSLAVEQDAAIHCTATTAAGATAHWTYKLNRDDSEYTIGAESMNSIAKWEGAALLINTIVAGAQNYAVMDRWTMSHDQSTLTIHRQVTGGRSPAEGDIVYRREGMPPLATPQPASQTGLVNRPAPIVAAPPAQYVVPAGTHILLSLTNSISTKNSKEGDHVYLQTAVPVAQNGHIVIPRGSYVQGAVSKSTPAGRMSSKSELHIRFDTLTLPNGVTRDFRARLTSADASHGKVDSEEGKVTGEGKDGGKVARDVGIGSMGGVIVGSAAGHPITGLGVGAAAGAAAVLLSKNQEVVFPRGTSVEMILDRDLYFTADEIRR
jgi:hypothetical protein